METDSPQVGSADDETNIGMGQVDGHMRSSCSQEEVCRGLADQCRELSDSIEAYTIAADKYFGLVGTLGIGALAILVGNNCCLADSIGCHSALCLPVAYGEGREEWGEAGARGAVGRDCSRWAIQT